MRCKALCWTVVGGSTPLSHERESCSCKNKSMSEELQQIVNIHSSLPQDSVLLPKLESAVSTILAASKREATARARKAEAEMRLAEGRSPRPRRLDAAPPSRDGYDGWSLDEPAEPAEESVAAEAPEEASEASAATTELQPRKRKRKPPKAPAAQSHCQKPSPVSALQHFENSFGVSLSSGQVKDLRVRIQKMAE